ncbi:MAG: hypothetical protein K2M06_04460 [Muribaculaceae bacterium]|nr:hypothetical protein [Muribaculaceae bacterium]
MAEDNKGNITFGPQPYRFGQGEGGLEEEPTGVEDVRYDRATMQGSPNNPEDVRGVVDVANPSGSETPKEAQREEAVAGIDRKIAAYRAYIDSLPELETPEQRAKRERREKSKRIIGAVSDGLRAMSNLWFTSQYAPNMYNHEKASQLKETDRVLEKARGEREKNRDAHLRFAIGLGDAENERAKTLRELEAQQEQLRIARQKAQREADLHPIIMSIKAEQQKKAEQDAITAKYIADNKPTELKLENDTETAKAASYRASAVNSYASAGSHRPKEHHFMGKSYISDKDYEKDVREAARQYNERYKVIVEVDNGKGGKKKELQYMEGFVPIEIDDFEDTREGRRRRPRKPEEYAGEVERRLAEEASENMPPSRRNNNDNKPPTKR